MKWLRKLLPAFTARERLRRDQWCYRMGDCSGEGRPTCKEPECIYGAEPCEHCGAWKSVGQACGVVHRIRFGR